MRSLLVALLLKYFINVLKANNNYYDAISCGLPTNDYKKVLRDRDNEKEKQLYSNTGTTIELDNDYDYISEDSTQDDNDDEDNDDPMQRKVMGGARAERGELPWAVFIEIPNGGGVCGGTLISKLHVLTAAHCFWRNVSTTGCSGKDAVPTENVVAEGRVYVGGVCLVKSEKHKCSDNDLGIEMKIKRVSYAPFFEKGCRGTNDLAILELRGPVPEGINHICLPQYHNVDQLHRYSTTIFSFGWGNDRLRMAEERCKKIVPSKYKDTFCTYEHSERNVCNGDSGGGVTAKLNGRHYIVGIVSYGSSCDKLYFGARPKAQVMTDTRYYSADIDAFLGIKPEDKKSRWEKFFTKQKKPY